MGNLLPIIHQGFLGALFVLNNSPDPHGESVFGKMFSKNWERGFEKLGTWFR